MREWMDKELGKETFLEIYPLMVSYFETPFLLQGTALGAYRDKGFVPTELDIDIGLLYEKFTYDRYLGFLRQLELSGFSIEILTSPFDVPRGIVFKRDGIKFDFITYMRWKDKRYASSPVDIPEPYCIVHDASFLESPAQLEFFGLTCFVPNPIEQYLRNEYDDWETPREDHISRTRIYDYLNKEGIPLELS